ncbi:flagellar basal body rod protein FlgB [Metabacillus fastidiosus]|uniref:flagellar basal body rod protein FlgB n=1 Tax=Metabacillus fastidiosus TaxID=1458 RepID=UPI002E1C9189|nr:flagellar basal body rod protein FlgB [Metabacillus fastidiosus]MED4532522.1 flagellar basal body rod protein FlgB [Metabacillus fastidiosus]
MKIFSNTINSLEQALNQSAIRQKVMSDNIANVDTPNYKAKDVSFSNILQKEIGNLQAYRTDERHFEFGSHSKENFKVFTKSQTSYQQNGNNVDIDQEMTNMAKNQIQYNALVDRISSKFNSLKTVVKGGR